MPERWKLDQEKNRGARAEQFIKNETFTAAIKGLKEEYFRDLMQTSPDNAKALQVAHIKLKVLQDLIQEFVRMISIGNGAKAQIAADEALKEAEIVSD